MDGVEWYIKSRRRVWSPHPVHPDQVGQLKEVGGFELTIFSCSTTIMLNEEVKFKLQVTYQSAWHSGIKLAS